MNMDKEKKSEIHITNNFNAPIGQHIDHVDTINFRMDGDGNFHFGMVDNVTKDKKLSPEMLARAIENCQLYFWANASYAVVFCICRDSYKIKMSKSDFEEMIEKLPYTKKRSHTCPTGTIANAFSDNPIYADPISEWDNRASKRIIKLRDELLSELKL
jgi:hypothetical protein